MPLLPGYGETPVPDDETQALLPQVRELLEEPIRKADVYDLEQALQDEVAEELLVSVLGGAVTLDDLVTDHFLRELHRRLYGDIWSWAGLFRQRELNIGVAPEMIATELRTSLETIRYRWQHTEDWSPHELGIAVHAEAVRIHPFTDGNGRATRLLADLVFLAAQEDDQAPSLYDWEVDKPRYIDLLRRYDIHRDPADLAAFINVQPLEQ